MDQKEYEAARRKLAAAGYVSIEFNEIFSETFEAVLGGVSEMVNNIHGGEEKSDKIQAERLNALSEYLQETYPGINTSEVVLMFAVGLMQLAPRLVFQAKGNTLNVKIN